MSWTDFCMQEKLRNSFYDGIFANTFGTLTGGVFLTAFALYLGLNEFMIGLLASMPFLATVFQLPTSYVIGRFGERKRIAFWAAAARLLWIPIVIFALLFSFPFNTGPVLIIGLIFLSHALISISYVSWLSWMSDLVLHEIRGLFLGRGTC